MISNKKTNSQNEQILYRNTSSIKEQTVKRIIRDRNLIKQLADEYAMPRDENTEISKYITGRLKKKIQEGTNLIAKDYRA